MNTTLIIEMEMEAVAIAKLESDSMRGASVYSRRYDDAICQIATRQGDFREKFGQDCTAVFNALVRAGRVS